MPSTKFKYYLTTLPRLNLFQAPEIKKPRFAPGLDKVETVGVEPTSENPAIAASTCVVQSLIPVIPAAKDKARMTPLRKFSPFAPKHHNRLSRSERRPFQNPAGPTLEGR